MKKKEYIEKKEREKVIKMKHNKATKKTYGREKSMKEVERTGKRI